MCILFAISIQELNLHSDALPDVNKNTCRFVILVQRDFYDGEDAINVSVHQLLVECAVKATDPHQICSGRLTVIGQTQVSDTCCTWATLEVQHGQYRSDVEV